MEESIKTVLTDTIEDFMIFDLDCEIAVHFFQSGRRDGTA